MSQSTFSRRDFLGRTLVGLTVLGSGLAAVGCGGEAPSLATCGTTGLPAAQSQMRTQLGYMATSPNAQKTCSQCALYTAPTAAGGCGGCQLNLGPVNPAGTCNSFAPRA